MNGDISKFEKLEHYNGSSVVFGNDTLYYLKVKGSIIQNDRIKCDNAYQVDGLKYNMLSVAQMNSLGYRVKFQNKKEQIYDAIGELIGNREKTRGNLFYLDLSNDTCVFAQFEDIWLWDKRPIHVKFDNLVRIN